MKLSSDEQAFVDRMAVYVAKGASFDDAAKAVVADDKRIADAFGVYEGNRKSAAKCDVRAAFAGTVYRAIKEA